MSVTDCITAFTCIDLAELATIHVAPLKDGSLSWVQDSGGGIGSFFTLQKNLGTTADGTDTIIPDSGSPIAGAANARWTRGPAGSGSIVVPLLPDYSVDPINGDDANTGSPSSPFQTAAWLCQVLDGATLTQPTTLRFVSSPPITDSFPLRLTVDAASGGSLYVYGAPTTLFTSGAGGFTAVTDIDGPANTPSSVTDTNLATSWALTALAVPGTRIRMTTGAAVGATAWMAKQTAVKVLRTSAWVVNAASASDPFMNVTTVVSPGDRYVVESLITVPNWAVEIEVWMTNAQNLTAWPVVFQNLGVDPLGVALATIETPYYTSVQFVGCDIQHLAFSNSTVFLCNCRFQTANTAYNCSLYIQSGMSHGYANGANFRNFVLDDSYGSSFFYGGDVLFQGRVVASNSFCNTLGAGVQNQIGQIGIFDMSTAGIDLYNPGTTIFSVDYFGYSGGNGTVIYGSGNGGAGMFISSTSNVVFSVGLLYGQPTITGTSGNVEIGGGFDTWNNVVAAGVNSVNFATVVAYG